MVDHGLMWLISVTAPSQVRPARLPCVLCHGRGGSHQGHGTPELMVSMGGNECWRTLRPCAPCLPETLLWPSGPGVTEHAGACIVLCALRR